MSLPSNIDPEWERDFAAALRRPLSVRMDYSFVRTPQPIMDDEPWRAFSTTREYREWCRRELPSWMGYD